MKKLLCFLMALIITSTCFFTSSAADTLPPATNRPTVYIYGQGALIPVADENGNPTGENIYPVAMDTNAILESVNLLHQPFAKGVTTGDWDDWCDTFVDIVAPIFEPYSMNEDGESKQPVYFPEHDVNQNLRDSQGKFPINALYYHYDWRSDPVESSVRLNSNINKLLSAQRCEKANIIGRCIGGNVLLTYLANYDLSNINSVAFYSEGFDGFDIVGRIFTGDITLDANALSRFIDDYFSAEPYRNDETFKMIADLVSVLNTMQALGVAINITNDVYKEVYTNVLPRVLLKSFGTMPSFWALVSDKYYEDAKKFVFGDEAETTYAKLVEKIDDFHYNYLVKYEEILQKAIDSGVKVYNITKYGTQVFPTGNDNYMQSDTLLELSSASAGATCSPINKKLSKKYLENADSRYISADKQIDAATCFMPDHTWFIKNMTHSHFYESGDRMVAYILDSLEYLSAPDCEKYPQFVCFDNNTNEIEPLTVENGKPKKRPPFLERLFSLLKRLFTMIQESINAKKQAENA